MALFIGAGPTEAYLDLLRLARQMQTDVAEVEQATARRDVGARSYLLNFLSRLNAARAQMQELAATPGLRSVARQERGAADYDIAAELAALGQALGQVRDAVKSLLADPSDSSRADLDRLRADGSGLVDERQIAIADTEPLRVALRSVLAALATS